MLLASTQAVCAASGARPAAATADANGVAEPGDAGASSGSLDASMDGGSAPGPTSSEASGESPDAAVDGPSTSVPTALVHFIGRFDTSDPAGPKFAWPASAIAAAFTGTGIDIKLSDAGTNYFAVVVDGGKPTTLSTSSAQQTYTLASNLSAGQHTLVVTKKTESDVGVVQYLGLSPQGGQLVPTPEPSGRRIEIVGDSISCGYGDLGAGPNCHFSPNQEDETVAYGALTAAQLAAEVTVVAYSGIGVYRNGDGSMTNVMPDRYGRILADDPRSQWPFTAPPPDVVVVNLSTNDFTPGDPGTAFQQAYVSFLHTLRGHYPSAYIIATLSPMLAGSSRTAADGYIKGAVSQVTMTGDAKVSYLTFDVQQASNGYGCDYHPSPATHTLMATKLVPAIEGVTGW